MTLLDKIRMILHESGMTFSCDGCINDAGFGCFGDDEYDCVKNINNRRQILLEKLEEIKPLLEEYKE